MEGTEIPSKGCHKMKKALKMARVIVIFQMKYVNITYFITCSCKKCMLKNVLLVISKSHEKTDHIKSKHQQGISFIIPDIKQRMTNSIHGIFLQDRKRYLLVNTKRQVKYQVKNGV